MLRSGVANNAKRFLRVIPKQVNAEGQRTLFCRPWKWYMYENEAESIHRQISHRLRQTEYEIDRALSFAFSPFHRVHSPRWGQREWWMEEAAEGATAKDGAFKLNIDMSKYKPENIKVKVVDRVIQVKVSGKTSEDLSTRWEYLLPKEVDEDSVQSFLNSEGMLMLEAQRRPVKEKEIPIQQKEMKNEQK